MKSVTVLLILVALVAGVAVSASRTDPAAGASAVLERCLPAGPRSASYHCQLMTGIMDERPDGEDGAFVEAIAVDDAGASTVDYYYSNPEKRWAQVVQFVADILDAAAKALDALTYGAPTGQPNSVAWVDQLFDTAAR